jgi:hypothetical protein
MTNLVFCAIKLINSQELNVPEHDVEQLLVSLILDNRIQGHIDQVNRLLERSDRSVYIFYFLSTVLKTGILLTLKKIVQVERNEEVYSCG